MTADRRAHVLLVVADPDTGKQLVIPIGQVPIPADRPPLTSDVLDVMRATIERVETRAQFDRIAAQYDGPTP